MIKYKKLFVLLAFLTIIILSCSISPSYAVEKGPPRFPKVELSFKNACWCCSILFNEVWPRARFAFVVKNITSKEDIDINEGVLILEIAEDTGVATEPNQDEFRFLAYKPFDTIKPDTQLKFSFTLSEKYKPGRFRIKPTLFIYPKGKSSFGHAYETMKNLGTDAFRAWEYSYFSEWEKNLPELGALRKEQGSYLIIIREFAQVLGYAVWGFVLAIFLEILRRFRKKSKTLLNSEHIKHDKKPISEIRNLQIFVDPAYGIIQTGEQCPYLILKIKNNTGMSIYITDMSMKVLKGIEAHPEAQRDISTNGYTLKFAERPGDSFSKLHVTIDTGHEVATGLPLANSYKKSSELINLINQLRTHKRNRNIAKYFILNFDCMINKIHHRVEFKF